MSCKYQEKLSAYLEEQLPIQEMQAIESHLDNCPHCQQTLTNLTNDELQLEATPLEVDDAVLISRIKARRRGIRRMTIYGFLGFILGIFSRFYTSDSFIVTKAIMALPYKLAELMLSIIFGSNQLPPMSMQYFDYHLRFFPFLPGLDLVAELLTPAIIATFIAITLGYLMSDRRVFSRKKIISFIFTGALVIGLWLAALYGVYAYTNYQIHDLAALKSVDIYQIELKDGDLRSSAVVNQQLLPPGEQNQLVQNLKSSQKMKEPAPFPQTSQLRLDLKFPLGGKVAAYVDANSPSLILINGTSYQLSAAAMEQLKALTEVKQ